MTCNSPGFSNSTFNCFILLHGEKNGVWHFLETTDDLQRCHQEGIKVKKTNPDAECWLFASPLDWNIDFIDYTFICWVFSQGNRNQFVYRTD